jgi:NTE family protein
LDLGPNRTNPLSTSAVAAARPHRCARLLAGLCLLALAGCGSWHYTVNAPLERYDPSHGYRFNTVDSADNSDELFVVLTFSGGGMRAAALAYAVLERLAAERIAWKGREMRLLDEVDLIYAVSGGSMVAAYYALHGDGLFRDFDARFFGRDLQDQIESRILSLAAIPRLLAPRYGRVDMVQEFLDETLYEGKTFADLPRRRPFVLISASDIGLGSRFEFTQGTFDLLCSDLDKFPIARAVAASSALPLVFSPVTLWNYAGTCAHAPVPEPPVVPGLLAARQTQRARELMSYLDRHRRPYIHLLDGGLADNIGVRGLIETAALVGGLDVAFKLTDVGTVRKLVIVTVNAETDTDRTVDLTADVPSLGQVMRALVDVPINRYSYETEVIGRQSIEAWHRHRSEIGRPVDLYLVEVGLKDIADPAEREFLNTVPTTLQLPKETVERIRGAGSHLLDESKEFQRLLTSLRSPR